MGSDRKISKDEAIAFLKQQLIMKQDIIVRLADENEELRRMLSENCEIEFVPQVSPALCVEQCELSFLADLVDEVDFLNEEDS